MCTEKVDKLCQKVEEADTPHDVSMIQPSAPCILNIAVPET